MDSRKEQLLNFIIEQHIDTAKPIGSEEVSESGIFQVSPATIRNSMAELEDEGFLFQPHVSAGRVPTNEGYRYYVDRLREKETLNNREREVLKRRLSALEDQMDKLVRLTARTLAEFSHEASLVKLEDEFQTSGISNLLKQPEFQDAENMVELAEMLDHPESFVNKLPRAKTGKEVSVYIGDESASGKKMNCSFIVSEISRDGVKQYLALVGPTRMNYRNNLRLMKYISELMSGGFLAAIIIINIF